MRLAWIAIVPWLFACTTSSTPADVATGDEVQGGVEGSDGSDGVDGSLGSAKLSNTTISGLVKDATTGKPIYNATITTDPPTESLSTNQQGQYYVTVGRAFGAITVQASHPDFLQAYPACVNLKPGVNNIGDVSMVRKVPLTDGASDCFPPCSAGTTCLSGSCISACNPQCSCSELCNSGAVCEADPLAPPVGICGANASPLGGGVCQCDSGFVPTGDGESCSIPSQLQQCPEGSERNDNGICECNAGKVPSVLGDKCLDPDEALNVTAISDGTVRKEWPTPGPGPRGIAFDGAALWVGDIAMKKLFRTAISDQQVLEEVDLGDAGAYLVDLAYANKEIFIVLSGTPESPSTPSMRRYSVDAKTLGPVSPSEYNSPAGLSYDGFNLLSLEGLRVVRREPANLFITAQTDVLLDPRYASAQYVAKPPSTLRYLAYTSGQFIAWVGTDYDGAGLRTELITLNAVNQTQSPEIGRLSLYIGASQIVGIEATGTTLWLAGAGSGNPSLNGGDNPPKIVEVSLD